MKYILLSLLLASCATTKQPEVQTECLDVGSPQGTITLCALPAGMICFMQNGRLVNCVQMQDPVLRASK